MQGFDQEHNPFHTVVDGLSRFMLTLQSISYSFTTAYR
ncbi:hypothetical protein ABIB34_002505 [Rhodococcus sp. UYP5]